MKFQSGFTIIELLITIAIAGVLVAVALPNFQNQIKNNCLTNNANELVTSLQFARSEATKRRKSVMVTARNTPANAANEWGQGWTVWQDTATNPGTMDDAEKIRVVELTCETTTMDEIGNDAEFIYRPTGFIDSVATLNICDNRTAETGRQLTISITGRPNVASFTCP